MKKRYASFNDLIHALDDSDDTLTKRVVNDVMKQHREFQKENLPPSELDEISMQMFRVKAIAEMVVAATDTFVHHVGSLLTVTAEDRFEIVERSNAADLCRRLKKFDRVNGFEHPSVLRLELRGHNYITQTMDWLWRSVRCRGRFEDYVHSRISKNYQRVFDSTKKTRADQLHLVCDAVSGMTDSYLMALHEELSEVWHGGGSR